MRKRGPQPPFYSHYRVFPVLSLYASTRCPPVWPLRPGGTSHQFSSTLEDIQNHVLKGHPGTMRKRGPQPPFYSHYRVFPVLSLYASTRCPPVWLLRPGGPRQPYSSTVALLAAVKYTWGDTCRLDPGHFGPPDLFVHVHVCKKVRQTKLQKRPEGLNCMR